MIRLAVRCDEVAAPRILAELLELFPEGVEEGESGGRVEYAVYGAEGELPDLGTIAAIAGEGEAAVSSSPVADDWADRWRAFHRPATISGRLHVRPPWADPPAPELLDLVIDPGRGFGTGAHPTTRLCLELLLALSAAVPAEHGQLRTGAGAALADWGTGSGVLAIAAAKLGWTPVAACDHDAAALEDAARNAAANGVPIELTRADARRDLLPAAPVVLANLVTPLLCTVAERIGAGAVAPPATLVCSGILRGELDRVAAAFAAGGLAEHDRRELGDWGALLLCRDSGDPPQ